MLEITHRHLGWPSRAEVLTPSGAGPLAYARLVQSKLGATLARRSDSRDIEVGILSPDAKSDATEPPLAVVCEFKRNASEPAIEEAHRLAWNFCRAPLLLTVEPTIVRAWTTCEPPRARATGTVPDAQVECARLRIGNPGGAVEGASRALSWVSLVSGQLFRDHQPRFARKACADESLLDNLKIVRRDLLKQGLSLETTHDLLARLIFVQFLFHRKDEQGRAALTSDWLQRQHEEGFFSASYESLPEILSSHKDSYALFRLLDDRFNGDLFPGKAGKRGQRDQAWRAEMSEVKPEHLALLADFVSGKLELRGGQTNFWPRYSFDVIPLEFISSIYEEFVRASQGTHYTPSYLVDLVLDTCLPWNSNEWDVKVLDPACGSGIFLVKAFQRLVYRWRRAHRFRSRPDTNVLRGLLTRNIFGADIEREAVRVACFSLYLAMCDELEPRHIWERVKFPPLRGVRLLEADFFDERQAGLRTFEDRETYDIVVGNAPWSRNSLSPLAKKWVANHKWPVSYGNIGPAFLGKAARLAQPDGRVSMIQPAGLLFNTGGRAVAIRRRLLEKHSVKTVINLAALRFKIFKKAVGGACVVCFAPVAPDGGPIMYVAPKPSRTPDDNFRIVIDSYDQHLVDLGEALAERGIWLALMWGGRRDYELIQRLSLESSLYKCELKRLVRSRQGIIRGNGTKRRPEIVGRAILDEDGFPAEGFPFLNGQLLDKNQNDRIAAKDSTGWGAFQTPQLILKLSWLQAASRFQARIVLPDELGRGALCNQSYQSVHIPNTQLLETACATYNSHFAIYYLMHTSGKFAMGWQEVDSGDLLRVPLPRSPVALLGVTSPNDCDDRVRAAFRLKPADLALVEDAFAVKMEAFRKESRRAADTELLELYSKAFVRVLQAGFGADKRMRVTVWRSRGSKPGQFQLATVYLDWPDGDDQFVVRDVDDAELVDMMVRIGDTLENRSDDGACVRRRVFRAYSVESHGGRRVPVVYLGKPNFREYWTRSMGMADADAVAVDLVHWATSSQPRRRSVSA